MSKVLSYAAFPLALTFYLGMGIYVYSQGFEATTYNIIVYGSLIIIGLLLESNIPYSIIKTSGIRFKADVLTFLFNAGVTAKIGGAIVSLGFIWLADNYFTGINWGPLWGQALICLGIVSFLRYWVHRLQHEVDFLWKWHAVHHSVPKVYSVNGLYAHPMDFFLRNVVTLLVPTMLGIQGQAIFIATVVLTVCGFFTHVNLPLKYGVLEWVFCSPKLHRWHHSMKIEESNNNYGVGLIIWDRLFGTICDPKDREYPDEMGVEGYIIPEKSVKSLVANSIYLKSSEA